MQNPFNVAAQACAPNFGKPWILSLQGLFLHFWIIALNPTSSAVMMLEIKLIPSLSLARSLKEKVHTLFLLIVVRSLETNFVATRCMFKFSVKFLTNSITNSNFVCKFLDS